MASAFGAKANRTLWKVFTSIRTHRGINRRSRPTLFVKLPRLQWSPTRMPPLSPFLRNKFLDVFAQQIRFEINGVSDLPFPQRGDFVSVRNDPDAKALLVDAGDRQADAIHGNRTFEDHVAHDLGWRCNVEHVVLF